MHTDLPNKKIEKEDSILEDSRKDKSRKNSEKDQSENVN